jgi:hypothetical protein
MLRHGGPIRGGLKFSNNVDVLLIISIENKDHGGPTRGWLKIFN